MSLITPCLVNCWSTLNADSFSDDRLTVLTGKAYSFVPHLLMLPLLTRSLSSLTSPNRKCMQQRATKALTEMLANFHTRPMGIVFILNMGNTVVSCTNHPFYS